MQIQDTKINILEKIANFIPISLAFLMPLFFLPTTTEFFEFNKLALLFISTLALLLIWSIRIALGEKIEIAKSILDPAIVLYTIVFALGTIFSINKTMSLFGGQGRWFPSLIGVITFFVYYFTSTAVFKNKDTLRHTLTSLIVSITIATIIALLSYFGVKFGNIAYLAIPNFNLSGSVTTTAILASIGFVLSLAFQPYENSVVMKVILFISTLVNFFFVSLVGIVAAWAALITGTLAILYFIGAKNIVTNKVLPLVLVGSLFSILLITVLPTTRNILTNKDYPMELTLPARESWLIASSTVQDFPLLATGPSTFQLNFSKYRPLALNAGLLWNTRFDKPYNEIFNSMAGLGIVGLIATLFIGLQLIKLALASKRIVDQDGFLYVATVGLIAMLPIYLFTYATVLNTFVLVVLSGIVVARQAALTTQNKLADVVSISFASLTSVSTIGSASALKGNYVNYVMALPLVAITAYSGYIFARSYMAEYYMRKAVVATIDNQGTKVYEYQGKAINLMPRRDVYHSAYARTNIALANALAANQNLSDEDKANIQTLIAQSIRSTRVATEAVNPLNVANWETRAVIYRSLINTADNADEWAINSYNTAIQLDPSNPALRLDLGGIYYNKQDYLTAANLFRQSASLKPNYANAHYNFAQALVNLKDIPNAIKELELTKTLVSVDSEDYKKVNAEIASLTELSNVAGAKTEKPSVEQITNTPNGTEKTVQEPLTKAAEEKEINNQNLNTQVLPNNGQTQQNTGTPQQQQGNTTNPSQPKN